MLVFSGCGSKTQPEGEKPETSAETVQQTTAPKKEPVDPTSAMLAFYREGTINYNFDEPEISSVSDTFKTIYFYRDGKKIYGELRLPKGEGKFPLVIISGGMYCPMEEYEYAAEGFAENGIAALSFNFTGTGKGSKSDGSQQELTLYTEIIDLSVVMDSLEYLPDIDRENVFLWGHSLGGGASSYVAGDRPDEIRGAMLIEPAYDYSSNEEAALKNINKDVLIFAGTVNATGPKHYDKAKEILPSLEVITIDGAEHTFKGEYADIMMEKCLDFIKGHIE